jgi:hypothetical protein
MAVRPHLALTPPVAPLRPSQLSPSRPQKAQLSVLMLDRRSLTLACRLTKVDLSGFNL